MTLLADFHVHSGFSDDSDYPLEQVARDAVRLNLDEICFTEHVDYGVKPEWNKPDTARFENGHPVTNCAYMPYLSELDRVRGLLGDQIGLRAGLELGVQSHTIRENHALVRCLRNKLDFAILSIHQVDNREFWNGDYQEGRSQDEIHRAYYEELLRVVECYRSYSVVGHLDLITRYDPYGAYPFEKTRDIVAAILEQVIKDGKGIEVNTSGIRYGLGRFQPGPEILALYRDLGGRIVTTGSDSHKPEHLGSYLRQAQRQLKDLGFEEFHTFEHWEPVAHRL